MPPTHIDGKAVRDLNSHLNRIAAAAERIADALEARASEDEVLKALGAALEAEAKATTQAVPLEQARDADRDVAPPEWMTRNG